MEVLPNNSLVDVANTCGLRVAYSLMKNLRGLSFIVPLNGLTRLQELAAKNGRPNGPYQIDDLPTNNWKFIGASCGVDVVMALFEQLGNTSVVIPTNCLYKVMHSYVVKHLRRGENEYEIILALGISRTLFYRLLEERPPAAVEPYQTLQLSLL